MTPMAFDRLSFCEREMEDWVAKSISLLINLRAASLKVTSGKKNKKSATHSNSSQTGARFSQIHPAVLGNVTFHLQREQPISDSRALPSLLFHKLNTAFVPPNRLFQQSPKAATAVLVLVLLRVWSPLNGQIGKNKTSLKNGVCHHRSAGSQSNPQLCQHFISVILASPMGIFNGTWYI